MLSSGFRFIVALAAAAGVAASPIEPRTGVVEISVAQVLSPNISALRIVKADQARHLKYKVHAHRKRQTNVPATNTVVSYVASVDVGSSGAFSLIIDTGSSNTWVGANKKYVPGSSSVNTGKSVSVKYGSGSFSGTEYTDTVTLGVTVVGQSIGVASKSTGFAGVDGILGVGPVSLTVGTVSGAGEIPTFLQNAASQGVIPANILGVSFKPTTSASGTTNGILTLGGTSSLYYTGDITYGPLTSTSPASRYWGIDAAFYGDRLPLGIASGIVDTGTTLIYLPNTVTSNYFFGTGFTLDSTTGLYRSSTSDAKDLGIGFAGATFTISAADTLIPSTLYSALGLSSSYYYSWVSNWGTDNSGLDFIIGQKALEHIYSVFDTDSSRLGFATAA